MHTFFEKLYSAMRCPLNHRWQLTRESADEVEHVCQKCGKHVIRHFNPPLRTSTDFLSKGHRLNQSERAGC